MMKTYMPRDCEVVALRYSGLNIKEVDNLVVMTYGAGEYIVERNDDNSLSIMGYRERGWTTVEKGDYLVSDMKKLWAMTKEAFEEKYKIAT